MEVIKVDDVSKKFKITHGKEETLKGLALSLFREYKPVVEQFWALRKVSFSVEKGETLGIIGPNGSGKTTMLRILAGIIYPDEGRVTMEGKISTLFELGTGFHEELTGRENIYLNGTILGLSNKEIAKKFDKIVNFSEIREFIDTPLKFYSSGMQVRLAFSVAINVNPDILLVDEVLAVGDASFQQKSFDAFQKFKKNNATIVFVSHDLQKVKDFCDRVIYIKDSNVELIGKPGEVIDKYLGSINTNKT